MGGFGRPFFYFESDRLAVAQGYAQIKMSKKGAGRIYQQTFIETYAVARPLPSQAPGAPLAEATAPPQ